MGILDARVSRFRPGWHRTRVLEPLPFDLDRIHVRPGALPTVYGSHPLLDPCYGSAALSIHHDGVRYSRLDKVGILAGWDVGLQHLRVCTRPNHPDVLNCGRCEKCTRTMLEPLALEKLDRCPAFGANDVERSAIRRIDVNSQSHAFTLEDVIEPLRTVGRSERASAVDRA